MGVGGAAGLGLAAARAPLAAVGAVAFLGMTLMPWGILFALVVFAAQLSRLRVSVAGFGIQAGHVFLLAAALRLFVLNRRRIHPRWQLPDFALAGFAGMQFVSSYLHSQNKTQSYATAGLLLLGVGAYFVTTRSITTRRRLILAAKAVLWASIVGAGVAVLSLLAHLLIGSPVGIQQGAGKLTVQGLAYEHDILSSTSGGAAIAFLVLLRERNPVVSRRTAIFGFWLCLLAMLLGQARGAWIAFGIVFVGLHFLRRPRIRRPGGMERLGVSLVLLALLGLGGAWIASQAIGGQSSNPLVISIQEKATQLLDFSSGSGAARVSTMSQALADLHGSPLLVGLGTNSFGQRHKGVVQQGGTVKASYIGNLYVRVLYDTGVIGALCLAAFLLAVLWPGRSLRRSGAELAPVATAFVMAYAVMAIAFSATDASFLLWPWILVGVAQSARRLLAAQERDARISRPGINGLGAWHGSNGAAAPNGKSAASILPI